MKTENNIEGRTYLLDSMPFVKIIIYEGKSGKRLIELLYDDDDKSKLLFKTSESKNRLEDVEVLIKGEISNFDVQLMNYLKKEQERQILKLVSQSNCVDKKQYHIINSDDVAEGANIIDGIFSEPKAIYIHPKQIIQIKKDANFLSVKEYPILDSVKVNGAIGIIGDCQVVVSDSVMVESDFYVNPIVKLESSIEQQEIPAVTILVEIINREAEENVVTVNYELGITNATKILTMKFHK